MIDLINDKRFKWVVISKEEDLEDGIRIITHKREKFLKEVNPQKEELTLLILERINKFSFFKKLSYLLGSELKTKHL